MDTAWKKSVKKRITKILSVIVCLLCVSGITGSLLSGYGKAIKSDTVMVNYVDAMKYRVFGMKDSYWNYSTFQNGFSYLMLLLDKKLDDFGNGTKEDYEKRYKKINGQNNEEIARIKQSLIATASEEFATFYPLVNYGIIEITATEFTGETESSESYYVHQFEGSSALDMYGYSDTNRVYVEPVMPSSVHESFKKTGYDGVIHLHTTKELFSDEYADGSLVKRFLPGYYAFKVNDSALRDKIYKDNLLTDYYGTYEEFCEAYINNEKEIKTHAETVSYYVRDGKGNYVTNLDNLDRNADEEKLKDVFSKLFLDEYFYSDRDSLYFSDGSFFSNTYVDYFNSGNEEGYQPVVHTTLMPEATHNISSPVVPTTMSSEVTAVEFSEAETTSFYVTSSPQKPQSTENTVIYIGIDTEMQSETCHFANMFNNIDRAEGLISDCIITCAILGILLIIAMAILFSLIKRDEEGRVRMIKGDRIFLEIRILINAAAAFLGAMGAVFTAELYLKSSSFFLLAWTVIFADIVFLAALDLLLYIVRHVKNKTLHKNISIVWLWLKGLSAGKKLFSKLKKNTVYVRPLKSEVFIKTAIVIGINILVGGAAFYSAAFTHDGDIALVTVLILFLFDLFIVYRGLRFVGGADKLFSLLSQLHKGDFDIEINKNALPPYLMLPAENLQGLGDGMREAVKEAVKQEKTKTELITNVSHDLKTPLTSIITYVDLLKKCDITDETAVSYINVLSEKSDRLKTLIEDLVEASKASAGAISVNYVNVSLRELLNQISGEFEDSFNERSLVLITSVPEEDVIIKADSKLIYRVLENLFVNIKKYAMEGTRVYLSVEEDRESAFIILRNISAAPLNITADQLKERFVRGEQSRTTEGNGLGLSIAENLCTLQQGSLEIEISADLFTVKVEMKKSL